MLFGEISRSPSVDLIELASDLPLLHVNDVIVDVT